MVIISYSPNCKIMSVMWSQFLHVREQLKRILYMLHAPYYNLVIKVGNEIFATKEHLIWFEAQFFALNLKFLWFITDLSEFRHEFNKTTACFCAPRVIWPFQELAIFQIFHHFFFSEARFVFWCCCCFVLFYFQ